MYQYGHFAVGCSSCSCPGSSLSQHLHNIMCRPSFCKSLKDDLSVSGRLLLLLFRTDHQIMFCFYCFERSFSLVPCLTNTQWGVTLNLQQMNDMNKTFSISVIYIWNAWDKEGCTVKLNLRSSTVNLLKRPPKSLLWKCPNSKLLR